MKRDFTRTVTLLGLLLVACGHSTPVNIGDVATLGAQLSDYQGSWDGYVEAYQFYDGSDRVHLTIDDNGNGALEVGDSPALPPPVADKGYPPSDFYGNSSISAVGDPSSNPFMDQLAPGFDYPIVDARVEQQRIRFATTTIEVFRDWCPLLTPILDPVNSSQTQELYECVLNPDMSGSQCFSATVEVDCGLFRCIGGCSCSASGCELDAADQNVSFDAALEAQGNELVGTLLIGTGGDRLTVRLTRQ